MDFFQSIENPEFQKYQKSIIFEKDKAIKGTKFSIFDQDDCTDFPEQTKKLPQLISNFRVDIQGETKEGATQSILRLLLNCLPTIDYKINFPLDITPENSYNIIGDSIKKAIYMSGLKNISDVKFEQGKQSPYYYIELQHEVDANISHISQKSDRTNTLKLECFKHYNDNSLDYRVPTNIPPRYEKQASDEDQISDWAFHSFYEGDPRKSEISNLMRSGASIFNFSHTFDKFQRNKPTPKAYIRANNQRIVHEVQNGNVKRIQDLLNAYEIPLSSYSNDISNLFKLFKQENDFDKQILMQSIYQPENLGDVSFNFDNAKFLIDHGANVNAKNSEGKTPLMLAQESNNVDGAMLLINNGAEIKGINIIQNEVGELIKKIQSIRSVYGHFPRRKEIAESLLDCMIKSKRNDELPLIARAARLDNYEALDIIIGMKNDNLNTKELDIALGQACRYGYKNIAIKLIKNGAKTVDLDESKYPLCED